MKKKNIILVGLLSLSLLTGCTTDKIERSQQDIKQEKIEKAKKEIANENKREKASSTTIIARDTSETERVQESNPNSYTQLESSEEPTTTPNGTESRNMITVAPTWWRECNANGHRATQGFDTQSGKYYWCCDDCARAVAYEICKVHNIPMTPEHMQLHLN